MKKTIIESAIVIIMVVSIISIGAVTADYLKVPIGDNVTADKIELVEEAPVEDNRIAGSYSSTFYNNCGFTSTTTPTFVTTGTTASSSCIIMTSNISALDLQWYFKASTTSAFVAVTPYYTFEDDPADQDWYAGRTYTTAADGTVTYSTNPQFEKAPALIEGDNFITTSLEGLTAKWTKLEYNIHGANGAVTLNVVGRNQTY